MKINEKNVIDCLTNYNGWKKADDIAFELNTSKRSVLYQIEKIKKACPNLILSSNNGYKISNNANNQQINKDTTKRIPANYEERKIYLVKKILINNEKLTLNEFAYRMGVSDNSLQNDISKFRYELKDYNLSITLQDYVQIIGTDYDKRKLIMKYINQESKISFYSLDKLQNIFLYANLEEIKDIINEELIKGDYFVDNYSLTNYVLHLALIVEMQKSNNFKIVKEKKTKPERNNFFVDNAHVFKVINNIYDALVNKYNLVKNTEDVIDFSRLFMTRMVSNKKKEKFNKANDILDKQTLSLLKIIIDSIYKNYGIKIEDENFLVSFGLHLSGVISRAENKTLINALQFQEIKNDYPLIYAISINVVKEISIFLNSLIPEAEIAYIALHIGSFLDKYQSSKNKVTCLVVCTNYNNLGINLINKINATFKEKMDIANVVTNIDEINNYNFELILSTIKLPQKYCDYQLQIDYFLSSESIDKISAILDTIFNKKTSQEFINNLQYFFHDDAFFVVNNLENKDEVINFLCKKLKDGNYIYDDYKKEIYEHEKISSSAYGKIAIPHPLSNNSKTSVIAVLISDKEISWNDNKVNAVFMLSINNDDKMFFKDIFSVITDFISDSDNFKKLLKIKNLKDFILLLSNKNS